MLISLSKANDITQHLMTCYPATITKPGELTIQYKLKNGAAKDFVIKYNSKQMGVTVEKIPLTAMEDKGVEEKWGDNIYRINFNVIAPKLKDKISFVITAK
jgi:hypothetical protein